MQTIQVAVKDSLYAEVLKEALTRSGNWMVVCVEKPEPGRGDVLLLDEPALERLRLPLEHPERVVLLARSDARQLNRAWEAGVKTVVSDREPLDTILLAVLAAGLRVSAAKPAERKSSDPDAGRPGGTDDARDGEQP